MYHSQAGSRVLTIDLAADPEKVDAEWLRQNTKGMTDREIRREYFRDRSVHDGLPVYPVWSDDMHLPEEFRKAKMPIVSGATLIGGWDTGDTLRHAFVLMQILPYSKQIQVLCEFFMQNTSLEDFCERLTQFLQREYPEAIQIYHTADPDIHRQEGIHKTCAAQVLVQKGFRNVKPSIQTWARRHGDGWWSLEDVIESGDGYITPRTVVCGYTCPILVKALRGAYMWEESGLSEGIYGPAAQFKATPKKDGYSDVANAFEYAMIAARSFVQSAMTQTHKTRWSKQFGQKQGYLSS